MRRSMKVDRPLGKLRVGDYPEVGDQLDAIWKLMRTLVEASPADDLPEDALDVMERVQGVKARFPKR